MPGTKCTRRQFRSDVPQPEHEFPAGRVIGHAGHETNARGHRSGLRAKWWHTYQIVGTGPVTHEVAAQPTALYQGQAFSIYWFQEN
jgi:hypothetical protein